MSPEALRAQPRQKAAVDALDLGALQFDFADVHAYGRRRGLYRLVLPAAICLRKSVSLVSGPARAPYAKEEAAQRQEHYR